MISRAWPVFLVVCSALLTLHDAFSYPTKPIRFIVTFAAGGGTDILARAIGQKLTEKWGQSVIVDNRAGANGNIGTEMVAKSAPDGYTILLTTNATIVLNPHLYRNLPFDPEGDLAPVSLVTSVPFVLGVSPSTPVKTVTELIALAKAKPGQLTYAPTGAGGAGHLSGELLKSMAKIDFINVPYKGGNPAILALISGEVNFMFVSILTTTPLIEANKIRAIAVTGRNRSPSLPNVPTVAETPGLAGFETDLWYGILAPARTDSKIVDAFYRAIRAMVEQPEFRKRFEDSGTMLIGNSPAEFRQIIKEDLARWGKVIKGAGVRLE